MSAGGRQSTVGGNALAKVSVNGTHLEAQMGALLSSVILPHHALEMPCAGYGRCGKCRVPVNGVPRLACRVYPADGDTVTLPEAAGAFRLHKTYRYGKIMLTSYRQPVEGEDGQ